MELRLSHATMEPPHGDSWNYANHTIIIIFLMQFPPLFGHPLNSHASSQPTKQTNKIHVLFMPTYQLLVHKIQATMYIHIFTCFKI